MNTEAAILEEHPVLTALHSRAATGVIGKSRGRHMAIQVHVGKTHKKSILLKQEACYSVSFLCSSCIVSAKSSGSFSNLQLA